MSKKQQQVSQGIPETRQSVVIGLVATEGDADAIAGAILRARMAGHETVVVALTADSEALDYASQLNAITAVADSLEDSESQLCESAREAGFPGVIYQPDPTMRVDYEQSVAKLSDSTVYLTTAVSASSEHFSGLIAGIPAYNEEVGIGSVVTQTLNHCDEVIVADDGSSDATVEIAREAGATVIEHETNQGKGEAVRTLLQAVSDRDYEAFILLDGDGQHSAADIPGIAEPVLNDDADMVIGSRYLEESETDETPVYRRAGQRVLDTLTTTSSRVSTTDSQSGFRALSPAAVAAFDLQSTSFGVESEMINLAAEENLTITEQPIDVRYDGIDGQTQNPLQHGLTVIVFILQLVQDRHPLVFFGLPGIVLLTVGSLYGLDSILVYRATGTFYPAKVLVAGFLSVLGSLSLFVGLVLNRISNMITQIKQ